MHLTPFAKERMVFFALRSLIQTGRKPMTAAELLLQDYDIELSVPQLLWSSLPDAAGPIPGSGATTAIRPAVRQYRNDVVVRAGDE